MNENTFQLMIFSLIFFGNLFIYMIVFIILNYRENKVWTRIKVNNQIKK